ncbi:MAG: KH domain-containing protein [Desulfovibrionaceae bacterium]|nr:KH domain-containing protein [Desulfovibrionaceae bacterium]
MVRARRAQLQEAVSSILAKTTRKDGPRQHRAQDRRPIGRINRQGRGQAEVEKHAEKEIHVAEPSVPKDVAKAAPKEIEHAPLHLPAVPRQERTLPVPKEVSKPAEPPKQSIVDEPIVEAKEQPKPAIVDVLAKSQAEQAPPATKARTKARKAKPKPTTQPRQVKEQPQAKPTLAKAHVGRKPKLSKGKGKLNLKHLVASDGENFDLEPELDLNEEFFAELPPVSIATLQSQEFQTLLAETLRSLVRPIVGDNLKISLNYTGARLSVHLDSGEESGLLIGREGQTLLSIQYLTCRILTHKLKQVVHLQLDAGEYRTRQKDKVVEIAQALAEKVRSQGRPFSTKPLSSYHRRLVHLSLQDAEDLQTRSIGNGTLKRVVIMPKRAPKHHKKDIQAGDCLKAET